MNELVMLKNNDCFTNSKVIADGTGIRHDKLKRAIEKNIKHIEKFGRLSTPYQVESTKSGRPTEVYLLNEQQATFLITLLKNTDAVINFKVKLVQEFYKMRQFILEKQSSHWLETRRRGIITRKNETDTIKDLIEYAKKQGSKNSDKLYMIYSKLANKMAGIEKRDNANITQLNNLSLIENIILNEIKIGMSKNKHYKEIYITCKSKLEIFNNIAYLQIA